MSLLWRLSDFMRDKPGIDQRLLEELKSAGHATFRSDITTWNIFKRWVWNRWYAPPKQPPQLEIIDDDA
ncbi:MAG: hypothetical protein QJR02_01855 [Sinobacteraceae bacterium]|nr:hypothetical protein [Nevskiaceae bacterium]